MTRRAGDVPLVWVDVFCDRPFSGNPAAVCLLDAPAPADAMQSVAFELGVSETAFVWQEDGGGFCLRWFTPATEVDLCGHATVAAAHVLRGAGRVVGDEVAFATPSGLLGARFIGDQIELNLPADPPVPVEVPSVLADCWPATAAAAGQRDLVVEVEDAGAVGDAQPPLEELARLPYRGVILTAAGGPPGVDYVLRFFGPAVGVPEDPVTGSAQCALAPYWSKRFGKDQLEVAQLSTRGGRLSVVADGARVGVAGAAVTVLTGVLSADAARQLTGAPR